MTDRIILQRFFARPEAAGLERRPSGRREMILDPEMKRIKTMETEAIT